MVVTLALPALPLQLPGCLEKLNVWGFVWLSTTAISVESNAYNVAVHTRQSIVHTAVNRIIWIANWIILNHGCRFGEWVIHAFFGFWMRSHRCRVCSLLAFYSPVIRVIDEVLIVLASLPLCSWADSSSWISHAKRAHHFLSLSPPLFWPPNWHKLALAPSRPSRTAFLPISVLRDEFRVSPSSTSVVLDGTVTLQCQPPRGTPQPQVSARCQGRVIVYIDAVYAFNPIMHFHRFSGSEMESCWI